MATEGKLSGTTAPILRLTNYGSRIRGDTNKTRREKVQTIISFAAKVAVGGLKMYDHATPAPEQLKWRKVVGNCVYSG